MLISEQRKDISHIFTEERTCFCNTKKGVPIKKTHVIEIPVKNLIVLENEYGYFEIKNNYTNKVKVSKIMDELEKYDIDKDFYYHEGKDCTDINISSFFYINDKPAFELYIPKNKLSSESTVYLILDKELKEFKSFGNNTIVSGTLRVELLKYHCPYCNASSSFFSFIDTNATIDRVDLFDDENKIAMSFLKRVFTIKSTSKDVKEIRAGEDRVVDKRYFLSYKDKLVFNKKTMQIYLITYLRKSGSTYKIKSNPTKIKNITFKKIDRIMLKYPESIIFFLAVKNFMLDNYRQEIEYICNDLQLDSYAKESCLKKDICKIENNNILYHFNRRDKISNKFIFLRSSATTFFNNVFKNLYFKKFFNTNNTKLAIMLHYLYQVNYNYGYKLKNLSDKEKFKKLKLSRKDVAEYNYKNGIPVYFYIISKIKDTNMAKRLLKLNINTDTCYDNLKVFLKDFCKNRKEKNIVTNLEKTSERYLIDAAFMYKEVKKSIDFKIDEKLSVKQIHDKLSREHNRLEHPNQKIPENEFLNKVFENSEFNGIKYIPAKETYQLVDTGYMMDICVGSYSNKAVNESCYIIIGYKEDIPVTCIELNRAGYGDNEYYYVNQVKKYDNEYAENDEQEYLCNLFEKNKISFSDCSDIEKSLRKKVV